MYEKGVVASGIMDAAAQAVEDCAGKEMLHAVVASMFVTAVEEMSHERAADFLYRVSRMLHVVGIAAQFVIREACNEQA